MKKKSHISFVLRRLEFLGLYSYLKIQPSLGRRSSSFHGSLGDKSIKRLAKLRTLSYISVILLLFLTADTIIPIYIEHTPVEAESGTATPSTLTFTSIKSDASVNLNVTSKDGTFATSTADEMAQFSISTNNYTGYTLKVRFQNGVGLSNDNGSNTLLPITDNVTASDFSANSTTGEALNNKWGYIPNYYNSSFNSTNTYYPASTTDAILRKTNAANSNNGVDNADEYTIGLGLRADYTNPSGTYTSNNTLILEYVANPVAYSINFSDDTSDGSVANLPSRLYSNSFSATSVTLTNNKTPTRTGHTFSKWCLGSTSNGGTTCNGTEFNVGGSFGIDQTTTNDVTLNAVWTRNRYTITWNGNSGTSPTATMVEYGAEIGELPVSTRDGYDFLGWFTAQTGGTQISATTTVTGNTTYWAQWEKANPFNTAFAGKEKQNGYYKMQDMSASICDAVPTPTTTTEDISTQLIDTRDNKIYWVSKLKDGNCWMTQNLDFVISTSGTELKTTDSNVSSNKTITAVNGWSYEDISFYEGGDKYLPNGSDSATDITCNSTTNGGENCHYHVGNYYSWKAATAGSGTSSVLGADAPESICPKGWRLPTSNSTTANYSFGKLTTAYSISSNAAGVAALISSPLWFVRAGYASSGSLGYQGTRGYVWSSRANSDARSAHNFYFSSYVDPSNIGGRGLGDSVRCVAE